MICPSDHQPCTGDHSWECHDSCARQMRKEQKERERIRNLPSGSRHDTIENMKGALDE